MTHYITYYIVYITHVYHIIYVYIYIYCICILYRECICILELILDGSNPTLYFPVFFPLKLFSCLLALELLFFIPLFYPPLPSKVYLLFS